MVVENTVSRVCLVSPFAFGAYSSGFDIDKAVVNMLSRVPRGHVLSPRPVTRHKDAQFPLVTRRSRPGNKGMGVVYVPCFLQYPPPPKPVRKKNHTQHNGVFTQRQREARIACNSLDGRGVGLYDSVMGHPAKNSWVLILTFPTADKTEGIQQPEEFSALKICLVNNLLKKLCYSV